MVWIVVYMLSFTIGACVGFLIYFRYKPTLCDSCKYLAQKNCGHWKYRCTSNRVFGDCFDRAPTYCKYYERRDSNCITQK